MLNFLGIKTALTDLIEAVKAGDVGAALKNVSVLTALLAPVFGGMFAADAELTPDQAAAKAELPALKAEIDALVAPTDGVFTARLNWDVIIQIATLVSKLLDALKK